MYYDMYPYPQSFGEKRLSVLEHGSLVEVLKLLDDVLYYNWPDELAWTALYLHRRFGGNPADAQVLYPQVRQLADGMEAGGFPYRYQDALAKAAASVRSELPPLTLREVAFYIGEASQTLHSGAIQLYQSAEVAGGAVYISVDTSIIPVELAPTITSMINSNLPPGISVQDLPAGGGDGTIAAVLPLYNLRLTPCWGQAPVTAPWAAVAPKAMPEMLVKSGGHIAPQVVQKSDGEEERYVLNYVLKPDVEDVQGHVVSKEEIRKACHWWAENAGNGSFALQHVLQGGEKLEGGDIVMLENYLMPATVTMGDEEIPEGTWMLGARINSDDIWSKVLKGEINAWSIGALSYLDPADEANEADEDSAEA
jgi:hypothetical protein